MSDSSQAIVDVEVRGEGAERLAAAVRDWLVARRIVAPDATGSTLGGEGHRPGPEHRVATGSDDEDFLGLDVNGVEIAVGRRVFDAGADGIALRCDRCGHGFEPGDAWIEAVGAWAGGDDGATFACPRCGEARPLADWRGPWAWGLGELGIVFWNWPPLSERFVRALADVLGHRTVLVRSHL
jgi:uncharacterized C2H2 Zn-finger protein